MIKNKNNVFSEAIANIKVSKEASEKLVRIKERIEGMGNKTSPFRKIMKEE